MRADLAASLATELSVADYHRMARELANEGSAEPRLQVALLASFTIDFLRPFLVVEGARHGLSLAPRFGPFGQLEQQASDPTSSLYRPSPDALVIAMRPEDVASETMIRPFARGAESPRAVLADLIERIAQAVTAFRSRSTAPVLVANFAEPAFLPLGPFDANVPESMTYAIAEANAALLKRLATVPNVAIWDLAGLVRRVGNGQWTDPRLWSLARQPVASRHQPTLAAHLVRTLSAMLRPPAKCLVLDLDNTLWGGVIGDDGIAGIQLGDDHPGSIFKDFQRRVLALSDRGILLAVVSKNDASVAEDAFQRHPDMLIKWEDLAATRVNWGPKSANIREIAAELNLGSDQLVLFDDNPVEQEEVRLNAPEVLVLSVPADPLRFADALNGVSWFDQVTLSEEDRTRPELYRAQRERGDDARRFATVDEFLASLEMSAEVGVLSDATLARIAQLIGKTNQFNLTTRRHSTADLAAMGEDPSSVVAWLRVADRFGDQGLVGVGILRREADVAIIDTFLMSCRVMNRRVEVALASYLVEHARRLGCHTMVGEYLPTAKNSVVKDLYPQLGFAPDDSDGRRFQLDLGAGTIEWPSVIGRNGRGGDS